jgi:hypothetical protein
MLTHRINYGLVTGTNGRLYAMGGYSGADRRENEEYTPPV